MDRCNGWIRDVQVKILTFTKFYVPGRLAGGPIVSIANMIARLSDEFSFRIVTTDRDIKDRRPYAGVPTNVWLPQGKAQVLYLSPSAVSLRRLAAVAREVQPDVVYLNSFFDTRFTARMLLARRLGCLPASRFVLAPRGEFSAGALGLKARRKQLYIAALRHAGLLDGIEWHASTPFEAEDIGAALRLSGNAGVHVARDLGAMPDESDVGGWEARAAEAPLRVCSLARVSPMKNLLGAVRAVAKMRAPAHFTVYGPKEDVAYWAECEAAVRDLPPHVGFSYGGALARHEVYRSLARHDVFFLPTLGENYGHVIPEALSVGLPVVISDRTPWRGLAEKGVGYDGPLDEDAFARELDRLAALAPREQAGMRERCRAFAGAALTDPAAVEQNRRLFAG